VIERRAYLVSGRVQGVGFRWWTLGKGRRLGLSGTVRNLRDGSVEVRAAGPAEALDELERWLRQGPPGARVDGVRGAPFNGELPEGEFQVEY
jgi:acylphosphatase